MLVNPNINPYNLTISTPCLWLLYLLPLRKNDEFSAVNDFCGTYEQKLFSLVSSVFFAVITFIFKNIFRTWGTVVLPLYERTYDYDFKERRR